MELTGQQAAGSVPAASMAEIVDLNQLPDTGPVIERASRLVRGGRLVALPTETVYGLLANADLPEVLERLNQVKGRPENRPYTFLIPDATFLLSEGATVSPTARRLIERFWPGPLTLVLPVAGGWRGFRCPNHDIARAVVRQAGCRVVAPSANRSGSAEPVCAADVRRELGDRIDMILDGGVCRIGRPSTVVRVAGDRLERLREGAIPWEDIKACAR